MIFSPRIPPLSAQPKLPWISRRQNLATGELIDYKETHTSNLRAPPPPSLPASSNFLWVHGGRAMGVCVSAARLVWSGRGRGVGVLRKDLLDILNQAD